MLVSVAFICDLRNSDGDSVAASILANNVSEAIWEFVVFTVSHSSDITMSIGLYVINVHSSLHVLCHNDVFSFQSLRESLKTFKTLTFKKQVPTEGRDPLATAIDLASFSSRSDVRIVTQFRDSLNDDVDRAIKRARDSDIRIEIIGTVISQHDLFVHFRHLTGPLVSHSTSAIMEVKDKTMEVTISPLVLPVSELSNINVCKCHQLSLKSNVACSVSGKRVNQFMSIDTIGNYPFPYSPDAFNPTKTTPKMVTLCMIEAGRVSESLLVGSGHVLTSCSPIFHRLINEMRCHNKALIVQKKPTRVIGGEFWILKADSINPVIHGKQMANRNQIITFHMETESILPPEVYPSPVLTGIEEMKELSLSQFGEQEILATLNTD